MLATHPPPSFPHSPHLPCPQPQPQMAVAKGAIEKSMGGVTSRDTIRMKLQMDSDLSSVEGELKALSAIAAADDGKGKLSVAEVTARKEILETLKTEYYKVYERVSGNKHRGDKSYEQGGAGMPTLSKDALTKGAFAGAGVKVEREALTGAFGTRRACCAQSRVPSVWWLAAC